MKQNFKKMVEGNRRPRSGEQRKIILVSTESTGNSYTGRVNATDVEKV